ncbi:MAG: replication and repair protein RecF protein [Microgenomates group bacterium GW2011_GWB1_40_9]|nr:MAG: replication and repair protein RecF protein [Microgenomates group bacterium GW2011_GWC1_39_12]KKR79801.1 MAG: replication and repair protein RecF protein [Microgenomates group bacterium GW2011_GWB1_40_9]
MQLTNITLTHFRSYQKVHIGFSPTVTLLIGPNAIGKTNIIEAIFLCSTGKSFRAKKDSDIISWGDEVARVKTMGINSQEEFLLEIVITTGIVNGQKAPSKKYLVNNVPRRHIDFIGNFRSVLFSPSDLELVTDSPSMRREYLNTVLVQVDREYRRNLQSYERGLRQRNSLLDRISDGTANRSQLLFWNQLLIKAGSYITETRKRYIETINAYSFSHLSYQLMYDPSVISVNRLEEYRDEEIAAKSTLVGPQRDDFIFEKKINQNKIDISRFGSRGEQRLAVLWLKLAELTYIESQTGERPTLLLDDIFSELDENSREFVLALTKKQQTIITSAEEDVVQLMDNVAKVIRL